uniref:Aminoglycoside 6'-N-acetyltransferase n=1 Tax=Salmonella typhimurium TaxID=90371 RepID=Q53283_SALTM|nr:aminoglycoside 6'-N-acetyltransferase [Salmonella enterica subsp. enterica serovar Typhimurium]
MGKCGLAPPNNRFERTHGTSPFAAQPNVRRQSHSRGISYDQLHKAQHRDQQQRFRHTAPHDWHDLAMLYEWLNRSHIVEWWGGGEVRPTLADVQEQYLPSVLAQESVTPYIAIAEWKPIGMPSRTLLLEAGRMVGRRNRSRSTRNRPVTGECITTGQKAWEPSWFELWLSCCSMIPRSPRSKRTRRRATCERSDASRKRGLRGKVP